MIYHVVIPKKVKKELARIDSRFRIRILLALKGIEDYPYQGKKLQGERAGEYSYRVNPYRIIYCIKKHQLVVLIITIGHRGSIY